MTQRYLPPPKHSGFWIHEMMLPGVVLQHITIHSQYTHSTLTAHSQYTHSTLTVHSQYTHSTLTILHLMPWWRMFLIVGTLTRHEDKIESHKTKCASALCTTGIRWSNACMKTNYQCRMRGIEIYPLFLTPIDNLSFLIPIESYPPLLGTWE